MKTKYLARSRSLGPIPGATTNVRSGDHDTNALMLLSVHGSVIFKQLILRVFDPLTKQQINNFFAVSHRIKLFWWFSVSLKFYPIINIFTAPNTDIIDLKS